MLVGAPLSSIRSCRRTAIFTYCVVGIRLGGPRAAQTDAAGFRGGISSKFATIAGFSHDGEGSALPRLVAEARDGVTGLFARGDGSHSISSDA